MRLTAFTDYCLRVLIYVGLKDDELATIDKIVESYGINRNHVVKVVFRLGQLGYLDTIRGRRGGVPAGERARPKSTFRPWSVRRGGLDGRRVLPGARLPMRH